MPTLNITFFFLAFFIIQTTLLRFVEIRGIQPDLILIMVIFSGFSFPKGKSIVVGGLLGLAQDSLSGGIIGVNMLSKGFIGFCAANLKESIVMENLIAQFFLIAGATILEGLIFLFIESIFHAPLIHSGFWGEITLISLYNSLAAPVVFFLFKRFVGFKDQTIQSW